jgi:hypothetical protein
MGMQQTYGGVARNHCAVDSLVGFDSLGVSSPLLLFVGIHFGDDLFRIWVGSVCAAAGRKGGEPPVPVVSEVTTTAGEQEA